SLSQMYLRNAAIVSRTCCTIGLPPSVCKLALRRRRPCCPLARSASVAFFPIKIDSESISGRLGRDDRGKFLIRVGGVRDLNADGSNAVVEIDDAKAFAARTHELIDEGIDVSNWKIEIGHDRLLSGGRGVSTRCR